MRRLFNFPWRSRRDIGRDVDEEIRFHIAARVEALIAAGQSPDNARRQALTEFGDVDDARRYINQLDRRTEAAGRRRSIMGDLVQDLAYAVRKLRASPGFTLTAVLTLALGIGANTAIFSIVNGVLLRPLPFAEPAQLYKVWSANKGAGMLQGSVSAVDLDDWRAQRQQIEDIGGFWYADGGSGLDLTGQGDPQRLRAVFMSPGYFSTMRIRPSVGRVPREDEMVRGGRDKVVLLTDEFWSRQFGRAPSIVGSSLTLNGDPYEVLGVLPREITYPSPNVDIYVPFSTIPDEATPRIRQVRVMEVVARAKPGVTQVAVDAEMNAITRRLAQQYPAENGPLDAATVEPLQESVTGPVKNGLLVLLGAVAFVLLIACVNVASLQLARATVRSREIAVRAALGAGRGRIVRQLLTESVVLALVGGGAGIVVAIVGVRAMLALSAGQLPRGTDVRVDGAVLLFALGLSLVTGLLFGLLPALRTSAANVQQTLRTGGRGMAGGEGHGLRDGLVIAEVALAMMLVIGGGLMTRSFLTLMRVDAGFTPGNLLVVQYSQRTPPNVDFPGVYRQMLERVRAVPGVVSAGAARAAPLKGIGERWGYRTPGMELPVGEQAPSAMTINVSDAYFRTIGARIVDGREFEPTDRRGAPIVLVVNEAFAKQWFPGKRAVGERVLIGDEPVEIVGVVHDILQTGIAEPAAPAVYISNFQIPRVSIMMVVRTQGPPTALAGALRQAIWSVDPLQPITSIFTLDDAVSDALARPRLLTVLLGIFGALGLVLGALGLYGVLAYLVSQRQREIGVRLALGASPGGVLGMIVRRGLTLAMAGVVLGLVGALALGRYLALVLYGVSATDPLTLAAVATALLGVAALASLLPARRAAGVDPAVTLRAE